MNNKNIAVEDLLLYCISIGVLVYLAFYFRGIADDLNTQIANGRSKLTANHQSAEMAQIILRYDFGTNVLISNSARNNMSFMIGSVLAILGGMIIVRRAKTEANLAGEAANFKFNFQSNSPGLAITLLGAIIIGISIIYKDRYSMADNVGGNPAGQSDIRPFSDEQLEKINLTPDE